MLTNTVSCLWNGFRANSATQECRQKLLEIENMCRKNGWSLDHPEVQSVIKILQAQVNENNRLNAEYAALKNPQQSAVTASPSTAQSEPQTILPSDPPAYQSS